MERQPRFTHQCPAASCNIQVPDNLLACAPHWHMLSDTTKRAIYRTASMSVLAKPRREALRKAQEEWNGMLT